METTTLGLLIPKRFALIKECDWKDWSPWDDRSFFCCERP